MHVLHCILVRKENLNAEDVQLLAEDFRQEALGVTEHYQDQVFDWRAEDAGRWADEYPVRREVV
ncbi:MAG: hypothetical protein C4575_06905 [Desulforudis sp.]|nr:MAG: hypothetical protein C4575_06905 [Desulforudis sp.]